MLFNNIEDILLWDFFYFSTIRKNAFSLEFFITVRIICHVSTDDKASYITCTIWCNKQIFYQNRYNIKRRKRARL